MGTKMTVLDRLARLDAMTASECRLARYLENHFAQAAMGNLEEMSGNNAVSKATVTRFARRLGYANFREFNRALKDEISANFDLPLHRSAVSAEHDFAENPADLLRWHLELSIVNLQRTMDQIDRDTFATVLRLISDQRRRLFLISFATGRALLNYFYLLAKYHRPNICLLDGPDRLAHDVIDADASSVLLATAFDRQPVPTRTVLRHFANMGSETILITNRRSSPLLKYAKYKLFVHAEPATTFKSRNAMLVMLEALVSGMGVCLQSAGGERFREMERLRVEMNQLPPEK